MNYDILKAHVNYDSNNEINSIAVLWVSSPGWVRATYADRKIRAGYANIKPKAELNARLLQEVAAAGMNCPDEIKKLFGNFKFER